MSYYSEKIKKIRKELYSNDSQIRSVIAIRSYLRENYQAKINLDDLSNAHCISKYHMIRLFKKYYGMTPRQYLIDQRIERAKDLLKSRTTVTDACFQVGFESIGSFSTLFKAKTGRSPRMYQKEQFSRSLGS